MDLKDIAAISGKPGLYKVFKPTKNGVILASIEDPTKKIIANTSTKVSILKEISIYTLDEEGNCPLEQVMGMIAEKYPEELPVTAKSSEKELMDFIKGILPEYDPEKVYASDIKKLVSWVALLKSQLPEIFVTQETIEQEKATGNTEKKPKKPAATKKAKPKKATE